MFFFNLDASVPAFCTSEITGTVEAKGIFNWPNTLVGETSMLPCPYNNRSFGRRECQPAGRKMSEGIWGPIFVEQCRYAEGQNEDLFDLAKANNPCNVKDVIVIMLQYNSIFVSH